MEQFFIFISPLFWFIVIVRYGNCLCNSNKYIKLAILILCVFIVNGFLPFRRRLEYLIWCYESLYIIFDRKE